MQKSFIFCEVRIESRENGKAPFVTQPGDGFLLETKEGETSKFSKGSLVFKCSLTFPCLGGNLWGRHFPLLSSTLGIATTVQLNVSSDLRGLKPHGR